MNNNNDTDNTCIHYKCIMSIGMRCFTDIFLKAMNMKKFSGIFDGMYNTDVNDIIDIMTYGISNNELLNTETMNDVIIQELNKKHGYRTIHKRYNYKPNDLFYSYHNAFLPHHNLNNINDRLHFDKCITRLNTIKDQNIRTLFCLFIHPDYSTDSDVSYHDIEKLKDFLISNYNCKFLVCKFQKQDNNYNWKCLFEDEHTTYIHINNSSNNFSDNETEMNQIMSYMNVDISKLLTYEDMNISI